MTRAQLHHLLAALRDQMVGSPLMVLGVLGALLVCLVVAVLGSRLAALALVPLAGLWLLCNQLVEGPTLLVLSANHGITVADLLSALALLVAGGRLLAPARA